MTRYIFLACILALVTHTAVADVLSQFVLPESQCPADVAIDANGRIATLVINQNDAGLLLFDPDLTLRVNKRFSSIGRISPSDIAATLDGGFVVVGAIVLPSGDTDGIVFKVSSTGKIVWKRIFGTAENDELHGVTVLEDGSIAVLGHRISAITSYDLLIARFSERGRLLWRKVIGTPALDHGSRITSAIGPSLMVSAGTGNGPFLPLWIKLSLSGAVLIARVGSSPESAGIFYLENPNGGYYLGSIGPHVQGQLEKTTISRFDATDRLVWAKSYSYSGSSMFLSHGFVNADGSLVLVGNASTNSPLTLNGVVMKISKSGKVQWKRTLNLALSTFSGAVPQTDGSIFAAGCIGWNTQASDVLTMSLPLSGNTGGCSNLTSAPISKQRDSMTLSDFSIAELPASFRKRKAPIQRATAQSAKSAVCP